MTKDNQCNHAGRYLYLLVIETPGRKQEMHMLHSRKQRTAYKAQHAEWYLNSTYVEYDLSEHLINQYLNK